MRVKIVLGILCSFIAIFPKPIESTYPHKEEAISPEPIQLDVHHFESWSRPRVIMPLPPGIYRVSTDEDYNYITGVILYLNLSPLLVPRQGHRAIYDRVKVRIDGKIANVTVPIPDSDPLFEVFYQRMRTGTIIHAEVK